MGVAGSSAGQSAVCDVTMEPISPVVLHIPHSSTTIPESVRNQFVLTDADLAEEVRELTDHCTEELFRVACPEAAAVVFPVSRLVVDAERFEDDRYEPMSARGMGVIYMQASDGRALRREISERERNVLLDQWYRPHHAELARLVDRACAAHGFAVVVDCHSFPLDSLPHEDATARRPELCIGADEFHSPPEMVEAALHAATVAGLDVAINTPFSGALVPVHVYRRDKRVLGLMLEVRRDLYLHDGGPERGEAFARVQGILANLIKVLIDVALSRRKAHFLS
jgi:N-formylglutamate deformylase